MNSTKPTIDRLDRNDLYAVYGPRTPPCDVVGYVMVLDGDILAIAGIVDYTVPFAFSNGVPRAQEYPFELIKMAQKMKELYKSYGRAIIALADDNIESSDRFNKYCGFREVMKGVYVHG